MSELLLSAVEDVFQQLACNDSRAVLLTGLERRVGEGFARQAPERWLAVPACSARMSVAAGLALGGRSVVAHCEDPADARSAPWHLPARLVAITDSLDVASAAWDAGAPVVAPAWAADLWPLLLSGFADEPVCVYLHSSVVPAAPPLALDQLTLSEPRTVTHGDEGVVAASGALLQPLLEAAWHLVRQGRRITVRQLVCLRRDGGPSPREAEGHVYWERDSGGYEPVPVALHGDERSVEEAVAAYLTPSVQE